MRAVRPFLGDKEEKRLRAFERKWDKRAREALSSLVERARAHGYEIEEEPYFLRDASWWFVVKPPGDPEETDVNVTLEFTRTNAFGPALGYWPALEFMTHQEQLAP